MAAMSAAERLKTAAQWMRDNQELIGITRAELQAAINATDDWIDANTASFNTALPTAARTALSASQKQLLFMYVLLRRNNKLKAEGD